MRRQGELFERVYTNMLKVSNEFNDCINLINQKTYFLYPNHRKRGMNFFDMNQYYTSRVIFSRAPDVTYLKHSNYYILHLILHFLCTQEQKRVVTALFQNMC